MIPFLKRQQPENKCLSQRGRGPNLNDKLFKIEKYISFFCIWLKVDHCSLYFFKIETNRVFIIPGQS